jgi:hypothetical protein
MKHLILLVIVLFSINSFAQKKQLVESQAEVEKLAAAEFETSMNGPEGDLYLFGQENNIEGTYYFKVTLGDRGKVVSIFVINREGGSVQMQNKVKDAVKATKFSFKLPKDKNFSLEYKFKF